MGVEAGINSEIKCRLQWKSMHHFKKPCALLVHNRENAPVVYVWVFFGFSSVFCVYSRYVVIQIQIKRFQHLMIITGLPHFDSLCFVRVSNFFSVLFEIEITFIPILSKRDILLISPFLNYNHYSYTCNILFNTCRQITCSLPKILLIMTAKHLILIVFSILPTTYKVRERVMFSLARPFLALLRNANGRLSYAWDVFYHLKETLPVQVNQVNLKDINKQTT